MSRTFQEIKDGVKNRWAVIKKLSPAIGDPNFQTTVQELWTAHQTDEQELDALLKSPPTPAPASEAVKQLQADMAVISSRLDLFTITNSPFRDNRKLLYQEAGQWARHFSTVRMTVMTFTITTCVAIFAWKGQTVFGKNPDVDSAMVTIPLTILWFAGVIVFWMFSMATYGQMDRQSRKRPLLPASFADEKDPSHRPFDWASLAVGVVNAGFMCVGIFIFQFGCFWVLPLILFGCVGLVFPLALWCYSSAKK